MLLKGVMEVVTIVYVVIVVFCVDAASGNVDSEASYGKLKARNRRTSLRTTTTTTPRTMGILT